MSPGAMRAEARASTSSLAAAMAQKAIAARDESGGRIDSVTDEQILAAQSFLAATEGIFVEPASAAGVAGLKELRRTGELEPGQQVVVTVTGHGLKDIDTALAGRGPAHRKAPE